MIMAEVVAVPFMALSAGVVVIVVVAFEELSIAVSFANLLTE
jgi:hypothetical protein